MVLPTSILTWTTQKTMTCYIQQIGVERWNWVVLSWLLLYMGLTLFGLRDPASTVKDDLRPMFLCMSSGLIKIESPSKIKQVYIYQDGNGAIYYCIRYAMMAYSSLPPRTQPVLLLFKTAIFQFKTAILGKWLANTALLVSILFS